MKIRYCPECGRSIPLDARVCPYCTKMIPMHGGQIVEEHGEKKDNASKIILIIAVVIIIIIAITVAIAATVYVYVRGMVPSNDWNSTPTITFTKTDTTSTETLTAVSVDPTNIDWNDLTILVDGNPIIHTLSGTVSAGDVIYFEPAVDRNVGSEPPITDYVVTIRHDPTNTLISQFNFVGN